ncbi:hypothetical protein HRbin11_01655 [bacterium HR11]|nr:hypothetical protein HRbin11_01655 [bacterium HR11]
MSGSTAFFAFIRWIVFGILRDPKACTFIDAKNDDLVLHVFLLNSSPPIHRKRHIRNAFAELSEASEFIKQQRKNQATKMQELADRHLLQGLLSELGFREEGEVIYGAKLCDAEGHELTDLDAYLPYKETWIELTTTKEPSGHFFEKLGKLAFIKGIEFTIKEPKTDPEGELSWQSLQATRLKRLFYLTLYPLQIQLGKQTQSIYQVISVFEDLDPQRLAKQLVSKSFLHKAERKFEQIKESINLFLKE